MTQPNSEPIYTSHKQARKHKPLPKVVKAVLRKRSRYRAIERTLRYSGHKQL